MDVVCIWDVVLIDFVNGVMFLWLVFGVGGLLVSDFVIVLDGVYFDLVLIVVEVGVAMCEVMSVLFVLVIEWGVFNYELVGMVGVDLIGLCVWMGIEVDFVMFGELVAMLVDYLNLWVVMVDGIVYYDVGGSDFDELVVVVLVGVAYLCELTDLGLDVDVVLVVLEFCYVVIVD